ncbi:MAG TPA: CoA transferase [Burkholderiales bacterium]|nr:CoA transferase [Burkholderiales bacterium]
MESKLHQTRYRQEARGPLDGVRVLDLSRLVAGNVVSHVLADFGAEVIKVEMPGRGDDLRAWKVAGVSTYWKVYARNKKSITLDYRKARGRELLLKLVPTASVLVENFVPGKLEKMGLAPEELHRCNERLIIVRVSGWGQTGPFAHKPGFGTLVEAMSGFASMNGYADRPPILPPLATADMLSGLYGASAALMALRHVEVSGGKGQVIDLSLFEPMLSILGPEAANYRLTGAPTQRNGSRASNTAPRNIYECSDGKFVALSASMQSMAERLFTVMGRADVLDDPRFRTNTDRVRNNDAIDAIVADFIRQRTQADNLELFDRAGVTVGPVCDAGDLMSHPYIVEREVLVTLPDPEMDELPMHNVVPRLSGTAGAIRSPAPDLGQHNEEIFGTIGVDRDELEELKRAQIV